MISSAEAQSISPTGLLGLFTESAMIFGDYDNIIRSFWASIPGIRGAYLVLKTMRELLAGDRTIVCAKMYSGIVEGNPLPRGLWNLDQSGFDLCLEPVEDGRQKGVDMSMGIDAIECARQNVCDTIILVTGDGDFVPVVRKIRS